MRAIINEVNNSRKIRVAYRALSSEENFEISLDERENAFSLEAILDETERTVARARHNAPLNFAGFLRHTAFEGQSIRNANMFHYLREHQRGPA
jgi:hypothetical protein